LIRRFDGVDILRGISILFVILLHISIRMGGSGFSFGSHLPRPLFHLFFENGNNGVTVFFAISGFLITWTCLRRFGDLSRIRTGVFYRLRFARIAPLLLLVLAVLTLLHSFHATGFRIPPQRASLPRALFAALTFHLNWLEADRGYLPACWDVLWSLSVEEVFYVFFPLACLLLLRYRSAMPAFVTGLFVFIAAGPFARTVWAGNEIWQEKSYLGGMDAIAMGCLCALGVHSLSGRPPSRFFLRVWEFSGVALILLIGLWPISPVMRFIGKSGLDGTILAIGTCLVVSATVLRSFVGGILSSPLRWLGRHSYEVYLTHEFVIVWGVQEFARVHHGSVWIWIAGIALAAMLPGALLARWFSEPLNAKLRGATRPLANSSVMVSGANSPSAISYTS
jgi:peptidoglycan/LPS O-acetylase OafA/YrhL